MINKKAFQELSYGIYLVSSEFNGKKSGYIANTVFQITSSPPRIAISCHKNNQSTDTILKSGRFAVTVLDKNTDMKLISTFGYHSGIDTDKYAIFPYRASDNNIPVVLDSATAWFECRIDTSTDLGSHILIIGEVIHSELTGSINEPLTYRYYREQYKSYSPPNSPTYIPPEQKEKTDEEKKSRSYECPICGYVYDPVKGDPASGIDPGTPFEEIPEDWECPVCRANKSVFIEA